MGAYFAVDSFQVSRELQIQVVLDEKINSPNRPMDHGGGVSAQTNNPVIQQTKETIAILLLACVV